MYKLSIWSFICTALSVVILWFIAYRKFPKYLDIQKICCNHSKIWTMWLYHRVMSQNDADRMANSVDCKGAVWSGSALFAQAYLSENLGSLRYCPFSGHMYSNSIGAQQNLQYHMGAQRRVSWSWVFAVHLKKLWVLGCPLSTKGNLIRLCKCTGCHSANKVL